MKKCFQSTNLNAPNKNILKIIKKHQQQFSPNFLPLITLNSVPLYNNINMQFTQDKILKQDLDPEYDQHLDSVQMMQQQLEEPIIEPAASSQTLFEAKHRLIAFIHSLEHHRKTELRADVIEHCSYLNKSKRVVPTYISDETIVRMASSRIDKMLKNKRVKKNWSEEDVKILVWIVSKYADVLGWTDLQKDISPQDWNSISKLIPGVSGHSCMFKWLSIKKVNLSSKNWDLQQSNVLRFIIQEQIAATRKSIVNLNWKAVAEKLYNSYSQTSRVFRSAKQCREHWNCFLNPNLKKGPWKIQEDILLLTKIRSNNGKKWSEIVSYFQGRTENALKNRFTLLIQKQKKNSKSKQERSLIEDCLDRCCQEQSLSTKQRRSVFISQIFSQQKKLEKDHSTKTHIEVFQSCEFNDSNRVESVSGQESSPSVQMKIKFQFDFDLLKQMAISKEMRPGCIKNGNFQPQH